MPPEGRASATIRWMNNPPEGTPRLTVGSRSFAALPLAVEPGHPLAASPGELMAGAVGSVFAWLLAEELMAEHMRARELVLEMGLAVDTVGGDPALREISCRVEARVPEGDAAALQRVAEAVMGRCITALALRADAISLHVESTLVG